MMRPVLLAALLSVPPAAAEARKKKPRLTPIPAAPAEASMNEPEVPDPPFVEKGATKARQRSPEAKVFAAFQPVLAAVTATRSVEQGGTSNGSAFVIHASGLLLTNNHVVRGAGEIHVRFSDGRSFAGRLAGAEPALDLAVIRIDSKTPLAPALLGDSDTIEVGDPVLALGLPLGLGATITRGILSGKERRVDVGAVGAAGTPVAFLQTDASVNSGSSGGPLTDLDGSVVGVTTAILPSARGVAFAIPINVVKLALPDMLKNAGAGRAFLGLTLGPANGSGAEVLSIRPRGPADRAGLKTGDTITSVRGRSISSDLDLAEAVRDLAVHETVRVLYLRRGKVSLAELTVAPVPVPEAHPSLLVFGGAKLAEFGPASEAAAHSGQSRGVMFAAVPEDSPAAEAGVEAGDVLIVLGMDAVADLDDLRVLLDRSSGAEAFRALVQRRDKIITLILPR